MEEEIKIKIALSNYDEIIKQLETIKKLLNDIKNIKLEVD